MKDWNAVRFDPTGRKGHVESYFLKLNSPTERRALWLKATILRRTSGETIAEAWAIAFDPDGAHVAAKEECPIAEASFSSRKFDARVRELHFRSAPEGGCRLEGAVSSDGHRIAFDLGMTTPWPALVPLPTPLLYSDRLPTQKLVSPHPDSEFDGYYEVDGRRVEVKKWRGMQGHNWGRKHSHLYGWGHCNLWEDAEDLVFEGATARVKIGPRVLPPLTLVCIWQRGVRYHLNGWKTLREAHGEVTPRRWTFSAENELARVDGHFEADTEDFVGLYYENPTGEMTHCLNSKVATGELRFEVKGRAPVIARTGTAAFEVGTRDTTHGMRMYV